MEITIMKSYEFHANYENHENLRISIEKNKNHENHKIQLENHENHEILRIP